MPTLAQLAEYLDGVWHGNANHAIFSFSSLNRATSTDICYFDNHVLQRVLASTSAGAVLLKSEHALWCKGNYITVPNPQIAMNKIIPLLSSSEPDHKKIHETAQIHSMVQLGAEISIGSNSVVGEKACLENGVMLGSNVVIEPAVRIGTSCRIGHHVVVHTGICRQ